MSRNGENSNSPRPKRRKFVRIAIGLGVVTVLLVVLLPTIAAPLARPMVEAAVNDRIKGHATIERLGLSWFGAQRVELTLDDPDGGPVASVTVRADRGLLGLALGSRRLGIVYVRGSATIVRDANGSTNFQRAIEARFASAETGDQGAGEPAALTKSLAASVVLDGLEVIYQDAAITEQTGGKMGAVRLGPLTGSADFAVGSPMVVTVRGPLSTGRDAGSLAESGSIAIDAQVTGLTDATGTLTPESIGASLTMAFDGPVVVAALDVAFADGVLTRSGETRLTINTAELAGLVPIVAEALAAQQGVEVARIPTISLSLESLSLPTDGDLRAGSVELRLSTTSIAGLIELPGADGASTPTFEIEPLELTLHTPSFGGAVTLTGGTLATIDGDSAGELSIDLSVGGLLDERGGLRAGVPGSVSGGLGVEGFSTAILQPFVAAINTALPAGLRLDLPEDLGPAVDIALDAVSHTDGSGAYDIDLALDAQHAELHAAVEVRGQRVASRGGGISARVAPIAPMLDRFLAAYGVRVNRGANVTLRASEFAVDLSNTSGEGGLDLRGTRAAFELTLTDAVGQVQLAGDGPLRDFRLERFALGLATDDIGGEVRVTSDGTGRLNGKPFAAMKADVTLSGLLDVGGAPKLSELPTFSGEVRVDGIEVETIGKVFGSLYADTGVVLIEDLGPRADILLLAAPSAGTDATDIDLTFRSSKLDITAPLVVTPNRVRSRSPIVVVDRAAGASMSRLLNGDGPVIVMPRGTLRLAVAGLDVPIEPGGFRPDRIGATLTATFTDFAAEVGLSGLDRPAGSPQRIVVPKLVATAEVGAGTAPTVGIEGQFVHADQPFSGSLRSALHELFLDAPRDAADPMSVLAVGDVRPETTLAMTDVPAALARIVPLGMVKIGELPLDAVLVSRDTLGRTFDVTVETFPNPDVAGATRFRVDLRGERATLELAGGVAKNRIRLDRTGGSVGVTPRLATHLAELFAPDTTVTPRLSEPAQIGLALTKPFELQLNEGFTPDLTILAGAIELRLRLNAAFAALTLPAAEGDEPMVVPPVRVRDLVVGFSAPKRVLGDEGGTVVAVISGGVLAADGSTLMNFTGEAEASVRGGKPTGATPVTLGLTDIAAPWIDEVLGRPALLAGALGATFDVEITADPDRFLRRDPGEAAISLSIDAPRFTTDVPLAIAINKDAVFLREPVSASWLMGPRWANLYVLGAQPNGESPVFAFTEQTRVKLELKRLALAMGDGVGLLKPGVFNVDTTVTIPELASRLSDGREMRVGDLELKVGRGPTPDQLGFSLTVPRMQIDGQAESRPEKSRINGRVTAYADANGNLTPDEARLSVNGGMAPIPTEVIDALARQDGLLRDLLGPTVDFEIDAQDFAKQGGTLRVKAITPFASVTIKGEVRDGLFIIDHEASPIEVYVITPALAQRFQKALPVVASLEKTRDDTPMRVIFETPLALPLDGNIDRLNGKVTIEIGTARFGTSDLFQTILSMAQQKTAGEVGRRMPPLKVTMVDGLVSYDSFALPFGEFKIETKGTLNLSSSTRQIDGGKSLPAGELEVLTFIPAGAFAAEVVPGLGMLPLPIIGNLARLPVRTSGLISKPDSAVAADLFGQEAISGLFEPVRLLDRLLGGDN